MYVEVRGQLFRVDSFLISHGPLLSKVLLPMEPSCQCLGRLIPAFKSIAMPFSMWSLCLGFCTAAPRVTERFCMPVISELRGKQTHL